MFEWLMEAVAPRKKKPAARAQTANPNLIHVDSRQYPLVDIGRTGFIAGDFDDTLITGQTAKITVVVNDRFGRFSFPATVTIESIKRDKNHMIGSWQMLSPEIEAVLVRYAKLKKAAASR